MKNLTTLEKHRENPFLQSMFDTVEQNTEIRYQSGRRTDQKGVSQILDTNTGELIRTTFLRKKEVDVDKFIKIFCNNVAQWADLSKPALKVFTWILKNLKPQADYVIINRDMILADIGYKSAETLYKGLRELVAADIIAKGMVDGMWFINPMVVFNGDRVVFATDYIKKKHPEVSSAKNLKRAVDILEEKNLRESRNNNLEEISDFIS